MKLITTSDVIENKEQPSSSPDNYMNEDYLTPLRFGLIVLLIGFGGFIFWASFAPLDQGEAANGFVEVMGNKKSIQHLEGGTVEEIFVDNGDKVVQGDILIKLNTTKVLSELNIASSQYIIAQTIEDRLRAEQNGFDVIEFNPILLDRYSDDIRFKFAAQSQEQLLDTRRKALESEINILKENLSGTESQLESLYDAQESNKKQIRYINQELDGVRKLAKDGYLPKNRMLELERDAAQLHGALSNSMVEAGRMQSQIAELKLRILQINQEYQKDVQSQLSDVRKEALTLYNRVLSLEYSYNQTDIKSPIEGSVQNLKIHTIGGVISPGEILMEVVPDNATYVITAELPVNAIDRVYPGLDVEITFPALNQAKTPNIPGSLLTISADRIIDDKSGMSYFESKVKISDEGLEILDNIGEEIRAGMPATILIKLGERTMMSYLFKPFLERLHTSLTEK